MSNRVRAMAAAATWIACLSATPTDAADAGSASLRRERFRQTVGQVLDAREFADLNQRPSNWLSRWFNEVARWIDETLSAVPTWAVWAIVIWMVATLVAILAHLIWTLWVTAGGPSGGSRLGAQGEAPDEWLGVRDLRFDSVLDRAKRLHAEGRWDDAVRYAYVAALLWLRDRGRITYHKSKTSGDFIREVSSEPESQRLLAQMTSAFESVAYRGAGAAAADAARVSQSLERLMRHATTP